MVSSYRLNVSIVFVTICLLIINIFPSNVHTSPVIIDGKYSLDTFFHPIQHKEQCNNYYTNNQYVCDPNSYIPYPDKQKLGDIMQKTQNNPIISCPFKNDGIQFGVLLISSFNDYHSDKINQGFDIGESSKFYAKLYHEKWEIGNEQCNNGILIFLNIQDKYLHISTSTFLKTNYISDEFVNNDVMPHIRSYLKNEQYADGIIKIIELITDKCQVQLVDKMVEREQNHMKNKVKFDNATIKHNDNGFWRFVILISVGFTVWLIWYTKCCNCCCGECDENPPQNNNNVRDEGVQFNEPGMPQNNNYNVNRMGMGYNNNNNNLRSRNVYNRYPQQQFAMNNVERVRKERQRKEREEKLRLEQQRKNEEMVKNGKRTKNGGGRGMSWDDSTHSSNAPDVKQMYKRTVGGGGGGGSW